MEIQIDHETKRWLQTKGKPVSIKSLQVSGCCAPPIHELMTHLGAPKDKHNYKEMKVDDILIFIEKPILFNHNLQLKLSGFGMFKTVSAKVK